MEKEKEGLVNENKMVRETLLAMDEDTGIRKAPTFEGLMLVRWGEESDENERLAWENDELQDPLVEKGKEIAEHGILSSKDPVEVVELRDKVGMGEKEGGACEGER